MYQKLLAYIDQMKHPYLKQLAESFFKDADFAKRFQFHSAAKSVHHGFVGGLLEHTLHVTQICDFFCNLYPMLNRDAPGYNVSVQMLSAWGNLQSDRYVSELPLLRS